MKESTAIELIKSKMSEMGLTDNYVIRYRHLKLTAGESRTIKAKNDLFFLIEPDQYMRIQSSIGIYDLNDYGARELQYVHTGDITIDSLDSGRVVNVIFIQVIPNIRN